MHRRSWIRMEQPPSHRPDLVEELQGGLSNSGINRSGSNKEAEMAVDFLRRGECDSPVMDSISPRSSVSLREVRWHRRGGSDDLIGDAFQRRRNSLRKLDCRACSRDGLLVGDEIGCWERVGHDHLLVVHVSPAVDEAAEVKGSPSRRYTLPLDLGCLIDYTHARNDQEVTISWSLHTRRRSRTLVSVPDC